MDVLSNVPAKSKDLLDDKPFTFKIAGYKFTILPLSGSDIDFIDEYLYHSIYSKIYFNIPMDHAILKELNVNPDTLSNAREKAQNVFDIAINLIQPINPFIKIWILLSYSIKYWYHPKKWTLTFKKWFKSQAGALTLVNLCSLLLEYSREYKKKLSQILLKMESITTTKEKQTDQRSSVMASLLASIEPGTIHYGMQSACPS